MQVHHVSAQTLMVLGILFLFYVIGDLVTTIWLVGNHPHGIEGESNPLGILIFSEKGIAGLIISKVIMFIMISVMIMILEFNYGHIRKIMMITNYTMLGLMAWSLVVVTINIMLIYSISLATGTYEAEFITKTYTIIFGVSFAGLVLVPKFIPSSLGKIEIILAAMMIIGPLAFSPGIYQFLLDQSIDNFLTYIVINSGIIGLVVYVMNRLYKNIIPKSKIKKRD